MGAVANSNPVKQGDNLDRIHQWFPILKERSGQLAGTLSGGETADARYWQGSDG